MATLSEEAAAFLPKETTTTTEVNHELRVVEKDSKWAVAKEVKTERDKDVSVVNYLKVNAGFLYNPFGAGQISTSKLDNYKWKYRKVSTETYVNYITFLKTRNANYLHAAENSLKG